MCVDECVCAELEICVGWSCGVTLYCVPALLVRLLHCSSDTRRDFETFLVGTLGTMKRARFFLALIVLCAQVLRERAVKINSPKEGTKIFI